MRLCIENSTIHHSASKLELKNTNVNFKAVRRLKIAEGLMISDALMGDVGPQSPETILQHINCLDASQKSRLKELVDWVEDYCNHETT